MNTTTIVSDDPNFGADPTSSSRAAPDQRRRNTRAAITGIALLLLAAAWWGFVRDDRSWQTADFGGQGPDDSTFAPDGARMLRRADGLSFAVDVPTPAPSTYEYPTADQHPPWADSHPPVSPGSDAAPEVFTLWVFIFNDPVQCTEGQCDLDDLGADTAARGGAYQVDGRIADGDRIRFEGGVRLGQTPSDGSRLDAPETAEVHLAIAPHGRVRDGVDRWRQLNGPLGNPSLWWSASFPSDG